MCGIVSELSGAVQLCWPQLALVVMFAIYLISNQATVELRLIRDNGEVITGRY